MGTRISPIHYENNDYRQCKYIFLPCRIDRAVSLMVQANAHDTVYETELGSITVALTDINDELIETIPQKDLRVPHNANTTFKKTYTSATSRTGNGEVVASTAIPQLYDTVMSVEFTPDSWTFTETENQVADAATIDSIPSITPPLHATTKWSPIDLFADIRNDIFSGQLFQVPHTTSPERPPNAHLDDSVISGPPHRQVLPNTNGVSINILAPRLPISCGSSLSSFTNNRSLMPSYVMASDMATPVPQSRLLKLLGII